MQVTVEATEGLEKKITVEVPSNRVNDEVSKRLKSMQPKIKMQGFRPGKVPMSIVEKRYRNSVVQEVSSEVVSSTFYEAVAQENLSPAGMPKIEAQENTDAGFKYTAVFEVYPEVKVDGVENITIERDNAEITEADIDNMVDKLRKQRTEWVTVERAAQDGDKLTCDYKGTIDGESFAGGEGSELPVTIGANGMIPGFEEGMIGAEIDKTVEMDLTFPESYGSAEVAGKDVHFSVTVKKIEEPKLPEINKEFIEIFGIEDGGIEDFRNELKSNMLRELDRKVKSKVKHKVMDALLTANEIDVPSSLVSSESNRIAQQMNEQMKMNQAGAAQGMQSFEGNQFKEEAKRRVALGLLLGEIVKANEIKVSAEKVKAEIELIASTYDDPKEVVGWYYQDKKRIGEVESMVLEDQVVDWVLGRAQVTDNMTSFDEVMKESR